MATVKKLLQLLNEAETTFEKGTLKQQETLLNEIDVILKELDTKGDAIKMSASNLRKINRLKRQINKAIINDEYLKDVEKFSQKFKQVEEVQTEYFQAFKEGFSTTKTLDIIREQTQAQTIDLLAGSGVEANITNTIVSTIDRSVKEGGSTRALRKQLEEIITGTDESPGILSRYTSQVATDSINGYSRVYNQIVTEDLGLEWYQYVGSTVKDTRPFCNAMVSKQYIHVSEFPTVLKGNVNGVRVPIYSKTGLPSGMIPGTNKDNFVSRAGGYRCNHLLMPVLESAVPKEYRDKITS